MESLDLQPRRIEQNLPLLLSPLQTRQGRHHHKIQTCGLPMRVLIGYDLLIDQNHRVLIQGGDDLLQDLYAVLVRPVVEYVPQVICPRTFDGLRIEEVVRHRLDTFGFECRFNRFGRILYDDAARQVGEVGFKATALVADPATNVDEGGSLRGKWFLIGDYEILKGKRVEPICFTFALGCHVVDKKLHFLWIFRKPLIRVLVSVKGKRQSAVSPVSGVLKVGTFEEPRQDL